MEGLEVPVEGVVAELQAIVAAQAREIAILRTALAQERTLKQALAEKVLAAEKESSDG